MTRHRTGQCKIPRLGNIPLSSPLSTLRRLPKQAESSSAVRIMVYDNGNILVRLLVRGLVNTDIHQIIERLMIRGQLLFNSGDDRSDRVPTDSQIRGNRFA